MLGWWPSRAVTFLDNHDTGSTQAHWPFPAQFLHQVCLRSMQCPSMYDLTMDGFECGRGLPHVVRKHSHTLRWSTTLGPAALLSNDICVGCRGMHTS